MDIDRPAVSELMADVAVAVGLHVTAVRADVYETIVRESRSYATTSRFSPCSPRASTATLTRCSR